MVKVFKLLTLVLQSVFLQFIHLIGLGAFLIAFASGYFRLKSWLVPIMAVVMGVAVDRFADVQDVTGLLERAEKANERGGFIILVYAVICVVGYVAGVYARIHHERYKAKLASPAAPAKK
ncbi:MAG TPA: hypothetical protein VK446_02080 [Methylocystis sp.]|nr:hypothetical protein [Methylocystis sp.]